MEPIASYLIVRDAIHGPQSALPDAPVVPYVEPAQPIRRTRAAVASMLQRLATVIEPPVCCAATTNA